jgi:hypothetical protein
LKRLLLLPLLLKVMPLPLPLLLLKVMPPPLLLVEMIRRIKRSK